MKTKYVALAASIVVVVLVIAFLYPVNIDNQGNTNQDQLLGKKWVMKSFVKD